MDQLPHIQILLQKALQGEASADELSELMDWIKDDDSKERTIWLAEYLGTPLENIPEEVGYDYTYWNQLADRVLDVDKVPEKVLSITGKRVPLLRRASWWAAAAVFILLCSVLWFWFAPNPKDHAPVAMVHENLFKNDVAPGGNKAILTLANGSTIMLDSAANGQLATQGNAKIVKLANGQLAYTTNGQMTSEVLYNTMSTPAGGQYQLRLPDGTQVWLNAASSIRYPTSFKGKDRRVEITGEAYFEVAKNEAFPFIVTVNHEAEVQVLGTHFNINAYEDEAIVKTTLLEGSIRITKGTASEILSPGQQAQFRSQGNIQLIKDAEIEQAVAWKNGYFSFNKADVQTVMRQIARWYSVDVRYEGKVPEELFGGELQRNSSLVSVLKVLEKSGVAFAVDGNKVTVLK